ncbi:MAG: SLBB domain-containing protein [Steroidobacteraceae bacterium]
MFRNAPFRRIAALILCATLAGSAGAAAPAAPPAPAGQSANSAAIPLAPLGAGDVFRLTLFGRTDMDGSYSVADNGTANIPLAGAVQVAGLSTEAAARKIEQVLKDGKFFINPQVSLMVEKSVSQRVSVVGAVRLPGRYVVDSRTTILNLLAEAGGATDLAADLGYIDRLDPSGTPVRYEVNIRRMTDDNPTSPTRYLRAGDTLTIPEAQQFFITGNVKNAGQFKLRSNLTVLQAVALAGGKTEMGSLRRIEITRTGKDGKEKKIKAKTSDKVQADDVIEVRESLF